MKIQTRAALEASIEHWNKNVAAATAGAAYDISVSARSCALCGAHKSCVGCPVKAKTGRPACADTPYYKAVNKLSAWDEALSCPPTDEQPEKAQAECLSACIEMRDFLVGLREEETNENDN